MNARILLVEDEPGLVMTMSDHLRSEHYDVVSCENGQEAYERALAEDVDLIILDLMLPGKNGFDICRDLRHKGMRMPILMLSARGQVLDKVVGLKLGADDYLTKPFDEPELLARVEALLRRCRPPSNNTTVIRTGTLEIDLDGTQVKRRGITIPLSAKEFELLRYLVQRAGKTVRRSSLLKDIWGYNSGVQSRTVEVHMGALRQKLEQDPRQPVHLITVRGFGYKFVL